MGCHIYGDYIAVLEEEEGIGDKIEDTLSIDETRNKDELEILSLIAK